MGPAVCGDSVSNTQDNNNYKDSVLFPVLKSFITIIGVCVICMCVDRIQRTTLGPPSVWVLWIRLWVCGLCLYLLCHLASPHLS